MALRDVIEQAHFKVQKDHFATTSFRWQFVVSGAVTSEADFTAMKRSGTPNDVAPSTTAAVLFIAPGSLPAGAKRRDRVTDLATNQAYEVVEIDARNGAHVVVTLEGRP